MLQRLLDRWRRRRVDQASQELEAWSEVCRSVVQMCSRALSDDGAGKGEIGVMLDKTDRSLFGLRDHASAAYGYLRRGQPALAARLRLLTDQTIELRNQTTRFLIRAQGPTPAFLDDPVRGGWNRTAHSQKAMEAVGLAARRLAAELEPSILRLTAEVREVLRVPTFPSK